MKAVLCIVCGCPAPLDPTKPHHPRQCEACIRGAEEWFAQKAAEKKAAAKKDDAS